MPRLVHHKSKQHTTNRGSIHVIKVPPKFWRPTQVNKYVSLDYADDVNKGIFDFKHYGKTVFRLNTKWKDRGRDDIIMYNKSAHEEEMNKGLRIGKSVDATTKDALIGLVTTNWDCFCKEGACRPIIGYEFAIDTGSSKLVCCKKPNYGPYESEI